MTRSEATRNEAGPCQGDCANIGIQQCPLRPATPKRPSVIPFEPIPENREKLEKWLQEAFESLSFNACSYQ